MKRIVVILISLIGVQGSIGASDMGATPASPTVQEDRLAKISSRLSGMTPQPVKDAWHRAGQVASPLAQRVGEVAVEAWNMVSPQQRSARTQAVKEWFACERTVEALSNFVERQKKSGNFDETTIVSGLVNAHNEDGRTLIQQLFVEDAFDINLDLVQGILNLGGDINARDSEGRTLFHIIAGDDVLVVEKKDLSVIEKFIQMGANPKLVDADGKTVLHLFALPPVDGSSAQLFDPEMIGWWVTRGVDPRLQDSRGSTIAHLFAHRGNLAQEIETYKYMFKDLRIDPNATDTDEETFLHILAINGLEKEPYSVLLLLKDLGVHLNAQNEDQDSVLDIFELCDIEITDEMVAWWKRHAGIIYPKSMSEFSNEKNDDDDFHVAGDSQIKNQGSRVRRTLDFGTTTSEFLSGSLSGVSGTASNVTSSSAPQGTAAAPQLPPISGNPPLQAGGTGSLPGSSGVVGISPSSPQDPLANPAATMPQPTKNSIITQRIVATALAAVSVISFIVYWKKTHGSSSKRATDQTATVR